MPVSYNQLNVLSDSRGILFEPLLSNAFFNKRNVHIAVSMPGVIRGNHYHIRGEETIAIMGPALVRFREDRVEKDIEIPKKQAYRFIFPPGIPHAIKNLSQGPNILVAFNTVEHNPKKPDSRMEVLIEN